MMKLDHTFSPLIEIDSHALHTATGGVPPPGAGGSISAAKPKAGKVKGIISDICLLGCQILGPQHPGPGDVGPHGPPEPGPQGRPPAAAPPFPGSEPKPIPLPGGGHIIIPE